MKIKINKEESNYSLTINSGHFSGTLNSISRESLEELQSSLNTLLSEPKKTELVWNPRSKRHEIVEVD